MFAYMLCLIINILVSSYSVIYPTPDLFTFACIAATMIEH